jgi:hypothetical protein
MHLWQAGGIGETVGEVTAVVTDDLDARVDGVQVLDQDRADIAHVSGDEYLHVEAVLVSDKGVPGKLSLWGSDAFGPPLG